MVALILTIVWSIAYLLLFYSYMKLSEMYENLNKEWFELALRNTKLFRECKEWEIKYFELEKQIKKDY